MRLLLLSILCVSAADLGAETVVDGRMPEDLMPPLRDIIGSALEGSDAVLEGELYESEAEGRRIAARASVLPSLRADVAFRQEREIDSELPASFEDRVIYEVSLRQPIYHWGVLRSQKEIGELQYEMARLSTSQLLSALVTKVRRDYMGLVLTKRRLARSRINLAEATEKQAFQEESVEKGSASDASLLPFQLAVEREALSVLRDESSWESGLGELSQYVSMDRARLESLIVDEIPEFAVLEEEALQHFRAFFDQGVERDEGLRKLDLDIEIDKRRLSISEQSLKPRINADLGLSSNALQLDGTRREQSYSYFGLSVGWNIFDGFRKKGTTLEALQRLSRKERAKAAQERGLDRKLGYLTALLEIESKALAIQERSLEASGERLQYVVDAVADERSPQSALADAERDYEAAQLQTQGMRVNYLLALSELVAELGLDLPDNP